MKKILPLILCLLMMTGCAETSAESFLPQDWVPPADVPILVEGASLNQLQCPFAEDLSDLSMRYMIYHFDSFQSIGQLDVHVPWEVTGGLTVVYTYLPWNESGYGTPVIISVLQGFRHEEVDGVENPYTRLNHKAYYFSEDLADTVIFDNEEYFICDLTLILTGYETIDDYLKEYPSYLAPVDDFSSAKRIYEHFHNDIADLIFQPEE